jgi:sulfoxide reductase heme-binding subunit YedZ
MATKRLTRRLVRHHLPLALIVSAAGAVLYVTRPEAADTISRLSFATAYPALALLAATLMVGPLKLLTRGQAPASQDLRRDFGIWAGIVGILHAVIGQCVHLRGRPWLYYVYDSQHPHLVPVRHDLFGFANYTGLAATFILVALLATSNDMSLRRFGTQGWKKLQRWNYVCFGLTVLHCFLYQEGVENQELPFVASAVLFVAMTAAIQFAGFRRRRAAAEVL